MAKDKITIKVWGGLGNQLFGWATGYAVAQHQKLDLEIDASRCTARNTFLHEFGIEIAKMPYALTVGSSESKGLSFRNLLQNTNLAYLRRLYIFLRKYYRRLNLKNNYWERSTSYDPQIFNVDPGTTLNGYFQSWKYFDSVREPLLSVLKSQRNRSMDFKHYETIFSKDPWIAIHVRRTDYLEHQEMFELTSVNYYANGINYFRQLSPEAHLAVFSDDINTARALLPGMDLYIGPDEIKSPVETMLVMSKAHFLIGSNSSFSWWAAYMMENTHNAVIFPRPWFKNDKINSADLLPKHWITLGI